MYIIEWVPFWMYPPDLNLGCLGVRFGFGAGFLYADIVVRTLHLYIRIGDHGYHSNLRHPLTWRKQR